VSEQLPTTPNDRLHAVAAERLHQTLSAAWQAYGAIPFAVKHSGDTRLALSRQIDCPDYGSHRLLFAEQGDAYAVGLFATDRRTRKPMHVFEAHLRSVLEVVPTERKPTIRELIILTANIKQSQSDRATRVSTIQDLGKHLLGQIQAAPELPQIGPPEPDNSAEAPPRRLYIVSRNH
jgi:hypothetical protein